MSTQTGVREIKVTYKQRQEDGRKRRRRALVDVTFGSNWLFQ